MTTATMLGQHAARDALAYRRESNRRRARVDNASLPSGSPMCYDCLACGGEIVVSTSWLHEPILCRECSAMLSLGWLE